MLATKQLILTKLTSVFQGLGITIPVQYPNRNMDVSNIKEYIKVYFIYGTDFPIDAMSKMRHSTDTLVIEWVLPLNVGENNTLDNIRKIQKEFDNLLLTDNNITINFNTALTTHEESDVSYKLRLNLTYNVTFYN